MSDARRDRYARCPRDQVRVNAFVTGAGGLGFAVPFYITGCRRGLCFSVPLMLYAGRARRTPHRALSAEFIPNYSTISSCHCAVMRKGGGPAGSAEAI